MIIPAEKELNEDINKFQKNASEIIAEKKTPDFRTEELYKICQESLDNTKRILDEWNSKIDSINNMNVNKIDFNFYFIENIFQKPNIFQRIWHWFKSIFQSKEKLEKYDNSEVLKHSDILDAAGKNIQRIANSLNFHFSLKQTEVKNPHNVDSVKGRITKPTEVKIIDTIRNIQNETSSQSLPKEEVNKPSNPKNKIISILKSKLLNTTWIGKILVLPTKKKKDVIFSFLGNECRTNYFDKKQTKYTYKIDSVLYFKESVILYSEKDPDHEFALFKVILKSDTSATIRLRRYKYKKYEDFIEDGSVTLIIKN